LTDAFIYIKETIADAHNIDKKTTNAIQQNVSTVNVIDSFPVKGDVVMHVQTATVDMVVSEFHVQVPDDRSSAPVLKWTAVHSCSLLY
jgi:spore maturation protein CgeB